MSYDEDTTVGDSILKILVTLAFIGFSIAIIAHFTGHALIEQMATVLSIPLIVGVIIIILLFICIMLEDYLINPAKYLYSRLKNRKEETLYRILCLFSGIGFGLGVISGITGWF